MSLLRKKRYERTLKQYLLMPVCWVVGHKFLTVTVNAGEPEQVVYTNNCLRCLTQPPIYEDRGLDRKKVC